MFRCFGPRALKTMTGLSGGLARSLTTNPNALSYDQLYNTEKDPQARKNLAGAPRYKDTLKQMREDLTAELNRFADRPFGEFVPGGDAAPGGNYDDVLESLRKAAAESKSAKKRKKKK